MKMRVAYMILSAVAVLSADFAFCADAANYEWICEQGRDILFPADPKGEWSPAKPNMHAGWADVTDTSFTPKTASSGEKVTVRTVMKFCARNDGGLGGAQAAIRMSEVRGKPVFMVSSGATGWKQAYAAGVVPDYDTAYAVEFLLDYGTRKYGVSVNGVTLKTRSGESKFNLAGSETGVRKIEYGGSCAFKRLCATVNPCSWTGNGDGRWDMGGNWSGGEPADSKAARFAGLMDMERRTVTFDGAKSFDGVLYVDSGTVSEPIVFEALSGGCGLSTGREWLFVGPDRGAALRIDGGEWSFGGLSIASGEDTKAAIANRGGAITLSGGIRVGEGRGAKALLSNVSGNFTMPGGGWFQIACGRGAKGYFRKTGGDWRVGNIQLALGLDSLGSILHKGGNLVIQGGYGLTVGCRGTGVFDMEGGCVTVPNGISLCGLRECSSGKCCAINLKGGTMATISIAYGKGSAAATLTFNGGTLKAMSDRKPLIVSHERLAVTIGDRGGTIDANGMDVTIEEPISGTGGMKFIGGGSVKLVSGITCAGRISVEVGTELVVPSSIAGNRLAFTVPDGWKEGECEVVKISGKGAFTSGTLASAALHSDCKVRFALSDDRRSIVCRSISSD